MMAELGERLSKIGLRVVDASVMMLIDGRADVTSSEIGRVLDIQRANMVPLLNRLEAAGIIDRVALDRKSMAIVLSATGQDLLAKARIITAGFERDLMARIPTEHRPHLVPALNALWR